MNSREKKEIMQVAQEVKDEFCSNGGTRGMCHIVSKEITKRLVSLGYNALVVNSHVDIGYHHDRRLSIHHYYVQVNNKYLDVTLHQFDRDRGHSIPTIVFGRKPKYVKSNSIYGISLVHIRR